MADGKLLEGWEGYSVERVEWPQEPRRTLAVHLKAMGREMHCEQYGAPCHQVQETTTRRVRDLPLFEHVPRRRVWCDRYGGPPRLEKLSWLGRYQRVTDWLAQACSQLLRSSIQSRRWHPSSI